MKTAAIYLRVSTDEQTTDNQLPAIQEYARRNDIEIKDVYSENESAWQAGHQAELARLLRALRTSGRRYDYLIVWALDRLTRQGIGALLQLINSFELYHCKVISIQESWTQVDGPMREFFIAITGWVGKFESDRRSERTKAGQARARKDGIHIGRPKGRKDSKSRHRRRIVVK